jgi:hypothetical protein
MIMKFCKDCGFHQPISNFGGKKKIAFYCKKHMRERVGKSLAGITARSTKKWPEISDCGTRGKCRECKHEMSLTKYFSPRKRTEDGSITYHGNCKFCRARYAKTRRIIRKHREREEARVSA